MGIPVYQLELAIASLQIFLSLLAILVCIEIMEKSSGRLKKSFIFFFLALIVYIFYTIGRIIDIEARFTLGKFFSLILNALTIAFILIGLTTVNKLLKEISKEGEMHSNKPGEKKEMDFLISAAKRFRNWALLQKNPKISGSRENFINWLNKGGYGKDEEKICEKLGITREDFTNIFNEYEKI